MSEQLIDTKVEPHTTRSSRYRLPWAKTRSEVIRVGNVLRAFLALDAE